MKYHQIDKVQQAVLQAAKDGRLSHLKVCTYKMLLVLQKTDKAQFAEPCVCL